jgi:hypothetical protein
MSSISDILTATKNIVTAINGLGQTYLQVSGTKVSTAVSAATLALVGQGRLVRVVVTTAGSAPGSIYDASVSTATTQKVFVIANTVGVTDVSIPVNNGIVIAPGTGQVVTVSYS